jgi:hypothetical protein
LFFFGAEAGEDEKREPREDLDFKDARIVQLLPTWSYL